MCHVAWVGKENFIDSRVSWSYRTHITLRREMAVPVSASHVGIPVMSALSVSLFLEILVCFLVCVAFMYMYMYMIDV